MFSSLRGFGIKFTPPFSSETEGDCLIVEGKTILHATAERFTSPELTKNLIRTWASWNVCEPRHLNNEHQIFCKITKWTKWLSSVLCVALKMKNWALVQTPRQTSTVCFEFTLVFQSQKLSVASIKNNTCYLELKLREQDNPMSELYLLKVL